MCVMMVWQEALYQMGLYPPMERRDFSREGCRNIILQPVNFLLHKIPCLFADVVPAKFLIHFYLAFYHYNGQYIDAIMEFFLVLYAHYIASFLGRMWELCWQPCW